MKLYCNNYTFVLLLFCIFHINAPPPGKNENSLFSEVKILDGSFMHKVKLTPGSSDHLVESYCAYNRRPFFN